MNRYDLAFKKASAIYKYHKEKLDVFAQCQLKGEQQNTYICMSDNGAKIFALINDTHLEELKTIKWDEYQTVAVKKGKIKSTFNFDQKIEIVILVEGEEVLAFLQNHTPLEIRLIQNNTRTPFKSWKLWSTVAAFLIVGIITYSVSHDNEPATNLSTENETTKRTASTSESIDEHKKENNHESIPKRTEDPKNQQKEVMIDINGIAGKSESEVNKLLGQPNSTEKSNFRLYGTERSVPSVTSIYRNGENGEIEITFIEGKAQRITYTPLKKMEFPKKPESLPSLFGLNASIPSSENELSTTWLYLDGLYSLQAFKNGNSLDYIYIIVDEKYK